LFFPNIPALLAAMPTWSQLYIASEWIIPLVMLFYVPQKRSTAAARTWLLLIFLLPVPGLLVYLVIGRIHLPKKRIQQQARASRHIRAVQEQMGAHGVVQPELPPNLAAAAMLATQLGDFEVFGGNCVELLTYYEGSLARLVADIDAAQHHVHLLYYIFEADETGRRVADALVRAAKRGIKCRVLMDAVGSKHGLAKLAPGMRAEGITVVAMLPVGFFRHNAARFDLRNHRKIAVIDGLTGYTGSQNITDAEFVKNFPNEELVVRVTGHVVAQLQAVFLADYYFETDDLLDSRGLFPQMADTGKTPAQLVPSGPGYQRENGQQMIVALLYAARERVVITTPYFAPDDAFLQAIRTAALRGVAVHVVVSKHANQRFMHFAQCAYYGDLLDAGVRIHLYEPHFLHAKHLSIDNDVAFIGSTNIDIRSFALNSEINMVIYDSEVVAKLRTVQQRYFENSELLDAKRWARRSPILKVAQNTARLADSLL
jgi:cardiolipin synthase